MRELTLTPKPFVAASPPCGSGQPSRLPRPAWSPPPRSWASSADCRIGSARPGASARRLGQPARQMNPRHDRTPAGGAGRLPPRHHPASRRSWLQARSRLPRRLPHGVVVHSGRPQVGVVQVVRRPVGKILALHPRCPGCRSKEGALSRQTDWSESAKRNLVTKVKKRRKRKLTIGGGLAREYGSLPNCHSSVSLQFAR